ncbi:hypothetical protein [Comamonas thiooxydans]|uniref:hypothetical protein n=1 Tax=Comamonas thiooxydans TaxID=363952 RepID=UPI0001BB158B|nr:hypothetical protein [Comamonas thiooxydans]ACY33053.1 phage-related protein [Comamonas thiooxydans]MDO1475227.1 hypothetical protein [Comamonas thiooxydans]
MLKEFTEWLLGLVAKVFSSLWDFVEDAAIAVFDGVVSGFVSLLTAIPVPEWVQGGLSSVWGGMDSAVLFYASQAGIPQALMVVGAGYSFRFMRKVVTLFQW